MLEILKTFSKDELLLFGKYLDSGLFNNNKVLSRIYQSVTEHQAFDEEAVKKLYGRKILGKKYSPQSVTAYCYTLNGKAKEFLSWLRFYRDENLRNEFLLSELYDRNVEKEFSKTLRKMVEENERRGESAEKYRSGYILNEKKYNYAEINSPVLKHQKAETKTEIILRCKDYKTAEYFTELVSLYGNLKINELSFNVKPPLPLSFRKEFISGLYDSISDKKEFILPKLYYYFYLALENFDKIHDYYAYRDFFFKNVGRLDAEEVKFHFQMMIIYCTSKKSLHGNINSIKNELVSLYKVFLEKRLFEKKNEKYIPTRVILNIIKLFKGSGNLKWLKEFVDENSSMLKPKDEKNIKHYLNVYYWFTQSKFDKALAEINKIKLMDYSYKYDIHTLKIRLLYEASHVSNESVLSQINAFRTLLRNDKFFLPAMKEKHLNFLKYLERLIKKLDNKNDIAFNLAQLKKDDHLYFKDWLIEKYENQLR